MIATAEAPSTSLVLKTSKQYSLREYLAKEDNSIHKHEFFNGKILRMPGSKYKHNKICSNVIRFLGNKLDEIRNIQYMVLTSDQKIYIANENLALYPDALVICEAPQFWENREDLLLNPLVIVEVASKSTRDYDRGEKFMHYKNIPSFKEYVLIEQEHFSVETWFRQDEETWKIAVVKDLQQEITLHSLQIKLSLSDIYKHLY